MPQKAEGGDTWFIAVLCDQGLHEATPMPDINYNCQSIKVTYWLLV